MNIFGGIGKRAVDDMVSSGEMERVVREAMAAQFEKLAQTPEYNHVKERLLKMARDCKFKQDVR